MTKRTHDEKARPVASIPQKPGAPLHMRLDERLRLAIQPGQGEPDAFAGFDGAPVNVQLDRATARRLGQALLKFAGLGRPQSAQTAELYCGKVATRAPAVLSKEELGALDLKRRQLQVQCSGAATRIDLIRRRLIGGARAKITPVDIEQLAQDVELLAKAPKHWAVIHALGQEALTGLRREQQRAHPAVPTTPTADAAEVAN